MTGPVFVDTNVFVYARDTAQPAKQAPASEWIERLWREQSGRTSIQVLNELYVTLTRKLKPGLAGEAAWDDIEALLAWDPQPVTGALLVEARRIEQRFQLSWWDSTIVAAARLQDCATLLSEDLQPGMRFGQVVVVSPFETRAAEQPARYEGVPGGVARRHRPRGRPRKITTAR
jgi:predicted nucleic acid-binding protein